MSKRKRNNYEEYQYDKNLRAEHDVMREVIEELRNTNQRLLENHEVVVDTLINTSESLIQTLTSLNKYRRGSLEMIKNQRTKLSHCDLGCTKHAWDTEKGWHRV